VLSGCRKSLFFSSKKKSNKKSFEVRQKCEAGRKEKSLGKDCFSSLGHILDEKKKRKEVKREEKKKANESKNHKNPLLATENHHQIIIEPKNWITRRVEKRAAQKKKQQLSFRLRSRKLLSRSSTTKQK
jgi:hypothetical protein